jgi:hypothetical protein
LLQLAERPVGQCSLFFTGGFPKVQIGIWAIFEKGSNDRKLQIRRSASKRRPGGYVSLHEHKTFMSRAIEQQHKNRHYAADIHSSIKSTEGENIGIRAQKYDCDRLEVLL